MLCCNGANDIHTVLHHDDISDQVTIEIPDEPPSISEPVETGSVPVIPCAVGGGALQAQYVWSTFVRS